MAKGGITVERLTYELSYKGSGEYDTDNTKNMPINMYVQVINKLGKLEDIEEEIGCPLEEAVNILNTILKYPNIVNEIGIDSDAEKVKWFFAIHKDLNI